MNIGKDGITETVIEEVKRQLRQKKLIKIKMMQALAQQSDKNEIAQQLAEATESILIDRIGFVIVLANKSLVAH